eukprot:m.10158 g.10158  ORF g.10158 m.10158 type:complete len:689 (-) comp7250_c0_seq1:3439-5505(-)
MLMRTLFRQHHTDIMTAQNIPYHGILAVLVILQCASGQAQNPMIGTDQGSIVAAIPPGKSFTISCPSVSAGATPCSGADVTVDSISGLCVSRHPACSGGSDVTIDADTGACSANCLPACGGSQVEFITANESCMCSEQYVQQRIAQAITEHDASQAGLATAGESAFAALLDKPLAWLGFTAFPIGARVMGPSGPAATRVLRIGGRGFDQLDNDVLQELFICTVGNETHNILSAPSGVMSTNTSRGSFVQCVIPDWPYGFGSAEVALLFLGMQNATVVPFMGGTGQNLLSFTQTYLSAALSSTLDIIVSGVGFGSNVTCTFTFRSSVATVQLHQTAVSTTPVAANCGPLPVSRLIPATGGGLDVPIQVSVRDSTGPIAFTGSESADIVRIVDTCTDGVQDGGETDVDCGGNGTCPRCGQLQGCVQDTDCDGDFRCSDTVCNVANVHIPPRARADSPSLTVSTPTLFSPIARRVVSQSGNLVVVSATTGRSLDAGDTVLIISLVGIADDDQPASINITSIGNYEFIRIRAVNGVRITMDRSLTNNYQTTNARHHVYMQLVPEYSTATISSTLTARWFDVTSAGSPTTVNGANTGIIAMSVSGLFTMQGGTITADAAGYWGGTCNVQDDGGSGGWVRRRFTVAVGEGGRLDWWRWRLDVDRISSSDGDGCLRSPASSRSGCTMASGRAKGT